MLLQKKGTRGCSSSGVEAANPMPTAAAADLPTKLPAAGLGDASALEARAPLALDGAAQLATLDIWAHTDPRRLHAFAHVCPRAASPGPADHS